MAFHHWPNTGSDILQGHLLGIFIENIKVRTGPNLIGHLLRDVLRFRRKKKICSFYDKGNLRLALLATVVSPASTKWHPLCHTCLHSFLFCNVKWRTLALLSCKKMKNSHLWHNGVPFSGRSFPACLGAGQIENKMITRVSFLATCIWIHRKKNRYCWVLPLFCAYFVIRLFVLNLLSLLRRTLY